MKHPASELVDAFAALVSDPIEHGKRAVDDEAGAATTPLEMSVLRQHTGKRVLGQSA